MAKGSSTAKEKSGSKSRTEAPSRPLARVALIQGVTQTFAKLIETFGWPGALLIVGWASIYLWATDDQKHRIIELYVLGTGIANKWPVVVSSIVFLVVLFAQRGFYLRKLALANEELAREGRAKSALQAQLSGIDLQHAQTRTPGGH